MQKLTFKKFILLTLLAISSVQFFATASNSADKPTITSKAQNKQNSKKSNEPHINTLIVEVKSGDTLSSLLSSVGVTPNEAALATHELNNIFQASNLSVGQKVTVSFVLPDNSAEPASLYSIKIKVSPETTVEVARIDSDLFLAQEIITPLETEYVRSAGSIDNSLYSSSKNAGIPDTVIVDLIKKYSYDVDFQRDIRKGDKFEVLYESLYDEKGNAVDSGNIIYALLEIQGKRLPIYRYEDESNEIDYYDESGQSIRKSLLKTPVDGARITSGFGSRKHPILGYNKMHKGIDFGAPRGTPVYTAGDGVIVEAGKKGSYGNYVRVQHKNGYSTAYAHLNKFAGGISRGARVKQGQIIAYVGTTGRSTGPHLHYEVLVSGKQINPLSIKNIPGKKLKGEEKKEFAKQIGKVRTTLAQLEAQSELASHMPTDK